MVWVWENLSNNLKSIYSIFVHWQGLVQAAILRRRRETEYVDVYHERCQVCICICICNYMDERQNMWTFIMSFVRFARSNTSPIKHSLINAMIRLLIIPDRRRRKSEADLEGQFEEVPFANIQCLQYTDTKFGTCIVSTEYIKQNWHIAFCQRQSSPHHYHLNHWMMSITCVEDQIFGEIVLSQNEAVEPLREEKEEGNWSLFDDHINEQIDQRRTEQIVWRQTSKSTKWPKTNAQSTKLKGRALEAQHFPKPVNLIFAGWIIVWHCLLQILKYERKRH